MTPLSVAQINANIIQDIETRLTQSIPLLPVAFARIMAKAIAGSIVQLYKFGGFWFLQTFVATASSRPVSVNGVTVTPLIEWGRLVGAGDPLPAAAAELTIAMNVTNVTGDPLLVGTPVVYGPTGVIYLTTSTILRDAAVKTVNIQASSDQAGGDGLGAIGNLDPGAVLQFASPQIDLERDVTVTAVVTTGADGEDLDLVYRQRVIDRFQKRPQGGALSDLEIWSEEAAGIINTYTYTGDYPGTAEVYCEADPVSSGSPDGIPTQSQLDAALDLINLDVNGFATRRPANMLAFTYPITRREFEVEVRGLTGPDVASAQTDIEEGMATLFATYEPYIGGLSVVDRSRITAIDVAGEVSNIAKATGHVISNVLLKAVPVQESTFDALVTDSADDASQTGSAVTLNGTTLKLDGTDVLGCRFVNVNVPFGADITAATLTLTSQTAKSVATVFTVQGEANTNPAAFTTTLNDITDRPTTLNSTTTTPLGWAVDQTEVVDVLEIVREIVSLGGWAALNAMAFIITSAATSDRDVRSYDDDPAKAPRLNITFTAPTGSPITQQVVSLRKGEKAKISSVTFPT